MIEYGLETFPDEWFSTYTSYLYIGKIHESSRKYQKAYDSYLMALNALGEMGKGYKEELSGDLCWMRLHIDSFHYSEELEELYSCYDKTDEFSKGFINSEFRRAIIQIVIALHHNQRDIAKSAYKQATTSYSPSYVGKLHNILARHNYKETLKTTPEAKMFLSRLNVKRHVVGGGNRRLFSVYLPLLIVRYQCRRQFKVGTTADCRGFV